MAYPKTYERAVEQIRDFDRGIKIVDLGCGKGQLVELLNQKGFTNIEYADISDKYNGEVKLMNFEEKILFDDNSFDVVFLTEVVHYVQNKKILFEEIKRILKKNGVLVITFPNVGSLPNRIAYLLTAKFIDLAIPEFNAFFIWDIPEYFSVEKIDYNQGQIPILRMPIIRSRMFGQTVVLKCIVKK